MQSAFIKNSRHFWKPFYRAASLNTCVVFLCYLCITSQVGLGYICWNSVTALNYSWNMWSLTLTCIDVNTSQSSCLGRSVLILLKRTYYLHYTVSDLRVSDSSQQPMEVLKDDLLDEMEPSIGKGRATQQTYSEKTQFILSLVSPETSEIDRCMLLCMHLHMCSTHK